MGRNEPLGPMPQYPPGDLKGSLKEITKLTVRFPEV